MPVDVLVRALRGIEPLVAAEVAERFPAHDLALGHREVRFRVPDLDGVAGLGTADDAFLVVTDGGGADLAGLRRAAATIDLAAVARRLGRRVAAREFDVSASVLGRRRFSRFDVEDAIGGAIGGWRYLPRRHGPARGALSLRAHLTAERTTIAARIGALPLHRRGYRVASRPGALHPPLARALVRLAGGGTVLDPCCGTGTIPIEARLAGVAARGSDIDAGAVAAARANADAARVSVPLSTADAARLPLPAEAVDAIAANPPWGRRVRGRLDTRDFARVIRPGGRLVLLAPEAPNPPGFALLDRIPVRVSGALVEIAVYELSARPGRTRA